MNSTLIEYGPLAIFIGFTLAGLAISMGRVDFSKISDFSPRKSGF